MNKLICEKSSFICDLNYLEREVIIKSQKHRLELLVYIQNLIDIKKLPIYQRDISIIEIVRKLKEAQYNLNEIESFLNLMQP